MSFAISQIPFSFLICDINCFISSTFNPITASIEPLPSGTASCIDLPLSCKRNMASEKFKESDATSALYSPRECPAKNLILFLICILNSSVINLNIE